jgi:hypothetical protein
MELVLSFPSHKVSQLHDPTQLEAKQARNAGFTHLKFWRGEQLRLLAGAVAGGRNPYAGGGRLGHGSNQNNQ